MIIALLCIWSYTHTFFASNSLARAWSWKSLIKMPQNVICNYQRKREREQTAKYTHDDNYLILFCLKTRFNFIFHFPLFSHSYMLAFSLSLSLFSSIYLCRQKYSVLEWVRDPKMKIKSLFFEHWCETSFFSFLFVYISFALICCVVEMMYTTFDLILCNFFPSRVLQIFSL